MAQPLAYLDDGTSSDTTFQDGSQGLRQFFKWDLVADYIKQMPRFVIIRKTVPELVTQLHRAIYRFNAKQIYRAQDEREDGCVQIWPTRIPICSDRATIFSGTNEVSQGRTANRVKAARPAFLI